MNSSEKQKKPREKPIYQSEEKSIKAERKPHHLPSKQEENHRLSQSPSIYSLAQAENSPISLVN